MDKLTLRKQYLQQRRKLSTHELEELSGRITEQFKSISFENIRYVHVFYPIAGKNEVNSLLLVNWLKKEHPEIEFVLPKSNLVEHTLEHILWTEITPLSMNEWGITEPASGTSIEPKEIDVVVIPLLVFDKKGNRIGYGKGFYDRFLTQCRPNVKKIGVSFFEAEEVFDDVNEFDIPLDMCITPDRVWYFKNL